MEVFISNQVPVYNWASTLNERVMKEVEHLSSLPFVFHHIALMPDAHAGKGMPIGGVLATLDTVVPNAVGVDIGCGMCAVRTDLKVAAISAEVLREQILEGIRKRIPIGFDKHTEPQEECYMPQGFDTDSLTVVSTQLKAARKQIGTLGGGNHFIELQRSEEGELWIMIHSGSRNLGKTVGDYYNKRASHLNRQWYSSVAPEIELPFLPLRSREFKQYWAEMEYCIEFAFCNRRLMMLRIQEVIREVFPEVVFDEMINIAHNYAAWEEHYGQHVIVHRKGAVRADKGRIGIIPGSQGTASYIVEGLGAKESFMSSSHGAGRQMSRSQARNTLSVEEEAGRLDNLGIVHSIRQLRDLDEAPSAYKDIEEVMERQAELVRPLIKLMPIAVIKG
ncbi:RtcB family protein [Porphyromonas gingivicanis]|uniref:RtcB family protein n=1 Tax=Porphyromonas gingivicanis TaxID=266762 RepID=UPI000471B057|nr:RtcB family protein [Porphyromonas gingivicanis]